MTSSEMSSDRDNVLNAVTDIIRRTIDEDWIADCDIESETRFYDDLEIESIEFVKIIDALQLQFGTHLEIAAWLSGKTIHELIGLSVGQVADYVTAATAKV